MRVTTEGMAQTQTNSEPDVLGAQNGEETIQECRDTASSDGSWLPSVQLLWDQRRFLFRVGAYGLIATTLVAFLIPKRYESTARLMPPDAQSGTTAMLAALSARAGAGLGSLAGDLLGTKSTGALFVGILRGRTIEDRLIGRFDLKKLYGARRIEDARKALENNTEVTEDRKSGIVTITLIDKHPDRERDMARAYVDELNRVVAEVSTSAARRERIFLEERLKQVKQDLDIAAKQFSEFASKNTAIDIKEQGRAMVEAAARLQGELIAAETQWEVLRQVYTDNNVRVKAARARVGELRQKLAEMGGQSSNGSAGTAEGTTPLYPSIRQLPVLGVKYADFYRQTKLQETIYELLTEQYELAKVQEAKEIPSVKVLDEPVIPEKKSFPPRLLIMLLGTLLSLSFGVVWILGTARWEGTDPQDPRKQFAQEVFQTLKADFSGNSQNGSHLRALPRRVWRILVSSAPKENSPPESHS